VLVAFAGAASRILPAVVRIQSAVVQIRVGSSGAAATRQLLARIADDEVVTPVTLAVSPIRSVEPSTACELHDVSFEYTPGVPALRNVSLVVPSGHLVAITGPSGAGKSTLVDVLLGLLRPSEGFVNVLGALPSLARFEAGQVAYVPQESALVVGTIRDNLALGRLISDDQVLNALAAVGLRDLISSGSGGLDATLTERGANLSGGQRQRLGLARALLGKPELLVLDEATSALDADSEQLISNTLESLRGTVTIIVVAHRLHTVESADTIVYLEGGELVELGTFDELSTRMPGFAKYAALQSVGGSAAPGRLSGPTRAERDERQGGP
jgi:ABC-type multidrug transport system fused ATPase/permease subunit